MSENHIVTFCTVPDRETGERIARALVEERLAACVNRVPGVSSTYRWEGKVEQASEELLLIKTTASRLAKVTVRIKALHAYEMPEVIAIPITAGSTEYLDWIVDNSK